MAASIWGINGQKKCYGDVYRFKKNETKPNVSTNPKMRKLKSSKAIGSFNLL